MDAAVPTSSMWWMARQWLRLLTGLVALAVALGAVQPDIDFSLRTTTLRASSGEASSAGVASAQADTGGATSGAADITTDQPGPRSLASAPGWVPQRQRPTQLFGPESAVVSPAGQRAPPTGGRLLSWRA